MNTINVLASGHRWEILALPVAQIRLLSVSTNPEATLAAATRTYTHTVSPDIDPAEIAYWLKNIRKTKLATPIEMFHYTFFIDGVTRGFTHQIVRYRVGTSFVQESLRFAVREKLSVLATPFLAANKESKAFASYAAAIARCADAYYGGLGAGIPVEDMRGILPTNILTRMFFAVSLKTLANIYTQRMCCAAQPGEWRYVCTQFKRLIREAQPEMADFLTPPGMGGKCGFDADFDKPCRYVGKTVSDLAVMEKEEEERWGQVPWPRGDRDDAVLPQTR